MKTKIFVTVRDRIESTKICIDSLIATTLNKADIYIYDNKSEKDLDSLMKYYAILLDSGLVASVTMNRNNLSQVYWSKAYAWSQFLDEASKDECDYVVMVDNDVRFHPDWLESSKHVLHHPISKEKNIKVISPWNGPPKYKTIDRYATIGEKVVHVEVREQVGTPCWFTTYQYMRDLPIPPYGLKTAVPDDVWYWDRMKEKGDRIGVLIGRLFSSDITPATGGSTYSARLTYVGEGYP